MFRSRNQFPFTGIFSLLFFCGESSFGTVNGQKGEQAKIIYDGRCRFCIDSVEKLLRMDRRGYLEKIDYNELNDPRQLHPDLTKEVCQSQLHLIESDGSLYGGFFVFRRLSLKIPRLYVFAPIFYFPGSGYLGPRVYRWVADNRHLFILTKKCDDESCSRS